MMIRKIVIATGVGLMLFGMQPVFAQDLGPLNAKLQQDEAQYKQDQAALQPVENKIKELNQQIKNIEQPFQAKYQGLSQQLQQVDKPYRDRINQIYDQMRQAEQPYRAKIQEHDEEQRRIDYQTRPLHDHIRELTHDSWEKRRAMEEDARRLAEDRAAIQAYQHNQASQPKKASTSTVTPKKTKTGTATP